MFSLLPAWCSQIQICLFFSYLFIRLLDMDSSREKLTFKWLRTTVTSPTQVQRRDADFSTPSRRNMSPHEESNSLPLSDSPGPEGFGVLSLDTPKRKAEVLDKAVSSLGKVKLRKLSKKKFETFRTSEVNLGLSVITTIFKKFKHFLKCSKNPNL